MIKLTKTRILILTVVALVVIARAVLPSIILSRLNNYLADFSPVYSIHIADLDLGILTFSYRFNQLEAHYKKDGHRFFDVKAIRVQLSLRELLHARILTNVRVDDGHFVLTKALFEGSKKPEAKPKETAKAASEKLFPVRIAVVEVYNSSFDFADFIQQDKTMHWRASDIDAKILNINPLPANPYTSFDLHGQFLENAPFKLAGKAKRLDDPMGWKVDFEMRDFNLVAANPMLLNDLPLTFTRGKLDLYSEVKSEKGSLSGYVKPFFRDVAILNKNEQYKGLKHFFYEIVGAFANFVLKDKDKVTATKIAFHEEGGHIKVDTGDALKEAFKNGFSKPLSPGTDDSVPFQ